MIRVTVHSSATKTGGGLLTSGSVARLCERRDGQGDLVLPDNMREGVGTHAYIERGTCALSRACNPQMDARSHAPRPQCGDRAGMRGPDAGHFLAHGAMGL